MSCLKTFLILIGISATACAATATAPVSDRHPQALHALAELHLAHVYLEVPNAGHAVSLQAEAAMQIDVAINDLHHVISDKGYHFGHRPHIDPTLQRAERFSKALELLQQAREACSSDEFDASEQAIRNAVIDDIDRAEELVERAIKRARAA